MFAAFQTQGHTLNLAEKEKQRWRSPRACPEGVGSSIERDCDLHPVLVVSGGTDNIGTERFIRLCTGTSRINTLDKNKSTMDKEPGTRNRNGNGNSQNGPDNIFVCIKQLIRANLVTPFQSSKNTYSEYRVHINIYIKKGVQT